jgi:hypothetical protein
LLNRTGQRGNVYQAHQLGKWNPRSSAYGRFWMDVPGGERKRRTVSLGLCATQWVACLRLREYIERADVGSKHRFHQIPVPGTTFRQQAEWWMESLSTRRQRSASVRDRIRHAISSQASGSAVSVARTSFSSRVAEAWAGRSTAARSIRTVAFVPINKCQLRARLDDTGSHLALMRNKREKLKTEISNLATAIAEGHRSAAPLYQLGKRERELDDISEELLVADPRGLDARLQEIEAFVHKRLQHIRGLLCRCAPG